MGQAKEFSFGITVMPRREVLDTQGRAVEETLKREGEPVTSCRVGRFVELRISAQTVAEAETVAKKVSAGLLANSLIETFEMKLLN
jgi:phosphoribosylformylglycinamidine (FGAM) synthase PurS component